MLESTAASADRERLLRMLRVTEQMQRMSARLLSFSRPPRRPAEAVAIRPVVDDAWALVSMDPRTLGVRCENLLPEEDFVLADADRLMQVFVNLLRNAADAVRPAGGISVHSCRLARAEREWISIRVDDDGPGIPADLLPRVFDAFVSGRADGDGTGLGLNVVARIVAEYGGRIEAANRPNGGARFDVKLPAARVEVTA
jgi:two-component system C4-dicarboxylate transport sensor histidine kinase DctB